MELDETIIKKIEMLALLAKKSPKTIIHEALDSYLETLQESLMEEEMRREREATTFTYDEFWDGVDI